MGKKKFTSLNNKVDDIKPFVYLHYIILDQGTEDRKFGLASFTYIFNLALFSINAALYKDIQHSLSIFQGKDDS